VRRPFHPITAEHLRAYCANCRVSAELCVQRKQGADAQRFAAERLRKAGWHVDGAGTPRERWYCAKCAKQGTNL
jgi:hypothetical protein